MDANPSGRQCLATIDCAVNSGRRCNRQAAIRQARRRGGRIARLPGLIELIERLPIEKRPHLVRGDAGAGGEPTMAALEARGQPYLFKQRLTSNVKRHRGWPRARAIERAFARDD